MVEDLIDYIKGLYPDEMVLDKIDEFTRGKLAGKIELIKEIEAFIEEEYAQGLQTVS